MHKHKYIEFYTDELDKTRAQTVFQWEAET